MVNWYSKFTTIRNEFEKVKRKCQIDKMLLDQEDEINLYNESWVDDDPHQSTIL